MDYVMRWKIRSRDIGEPIYQNYRSKEFPGFENLMCGSVIF